eukprot:TRINITY_DN7323_c0_g2_i8.p1 TRINITY_DN7323_c0_g2~~TRINITY_DN7323_c0_g2_i8.p1  ORF type:complete len:437 (-),score=76.31 TRINITY_DN7323_c0_g2_i8:123-1433(-)
MKDVLPGEKAHSVRFSHRSGDDSTHEVEDYEASDPGSSDPEDTASQEPSQRRSIRKSLASVRKSFRKSFARTRESLRNSLAAVLPNPVAAVLRASVATGVKPMAPTRSQKKKKGNTDDDMEALLVKLRVCFLNDFGSIHGAWEGLRNTHGKKKDDESTLDDAVTCIEFVQMIVDGRKYCERAEADKLFRYLSSRGKLYKKAFNEALVGEVQASPPPLSGKDVLPNRAEEPEDDTAWAARLRAEHHHPAGRHDDVYVLDLSTEDDRPQPQGIVDPFTEKDHELLDKLRPDPPETLVIEGVGVQLQGQEAKRRKIVEKFRPPDSPETLVIGGVGAQRQGQEAKRRKTVEKFRSFIIERFGSAHEVWARLCEVHAGTHSKKNSGIHDKVYSIEWQTLLVDAESYCDAQEAQKLFLHFSHNGEIRKKDFLKELADEDLME